jgi:hypothetical protein
MKTLILSDQAWSDLTDALDETALAKLMAADMAELPGAEDLHRMVRAKQTPKIFELLRDRLAAATDAQATQRENCTSSCARRTSRASARPRSRAGRATTRRTPTRSSTERRTRSQDLTNPSTEKEKA